MSWDKIKLNCEFKPNASRYALFYNEEKAQAVASEGTRQLAALTAPVRPAGGEPGQPVA